MIFKISALCLIFLSGSSALRLVSYFIPSVVDFRDEATLMCQFDPEGERLHSVKWFLNGTEFFRASPQGNVFHYADGVSVQMHKSNMTTVVLGPLYFTTSGEFRCEASTEPPLYRKLAISKKLVVVALPKEGPSIEGIHPRHTWGDDLELNCTSAPSYPAADLYWTIEDAPVSEDKVTQYNEEEQGLRIRSNKAGLRLQTDQLPFGPDGEVTVSCSALVPGIYRNTVSLRLAKARSTKN